MSLGDAYELRGEEPETIEQLVERRSLRRGAESQGRDAPAEHQGKPRMKDPRGRKPKGAASEPRQSPSEAGDGGGGVMLGKLVGPEEPGPGRRATTPGPEAGRRCSGPRVSRRVRIGPWLTVQPNRYAFCRPSRPRRRRSTAPGSGADCDCVHECRRQRGSRVRKTQARRAAAVRPMRLARRSRSRPGTLWRQRTMSSSTWRRSSAVQAVRCRWPPRDRTRGRRGITTFFTSAERTSPA